MYDAWWRGDLDARLPGGESALDLRARYLPAVERIVAAVDGVAATAPSIRRRAGQPRRRDPTGGRRAAGDTAETWYVPNTGLVVLRPTPGGWELEDWDTAEPVAKDVTAGGAPD